MLKNLLASIIDLQAFSKFPSHKALQTLNFMFFRNVDSHFLRLEILRNVWSGKEDLSGLVGWLSK